MNGQGGSRESGWLARCRIQICLRSARPAALPAYYLLTYLPTMLSHAVQAITCRTARLHTGPHPPFSPDSGTNTVAKSRLGPARTWSLSVGPGLTMVA